MASDKYVSRGGDKLEVALQSFGVNPSGKVVLDSGSSTGGFVDCLLQHGAAKVYAVDTAYGELAWKLRNDKRVVVMERTNILHMNELEDLVDLITLDVGWTRLEMVLPQVLKLLKADGQIIALLKPHYQTDQQHKGVLTEEQSEQVKEETLHRLAQMGFKVINQVKSPLLGGSGNKEFFILLAAAS